MKKHFKFISKSILLSVVSSTMISSGLILSSCVNKKDDNDNNDSNIETPNGEIKIEDQSPTTNEVSSDSTLTLYVNVASNKPVKYQWYVDKNNNTWTAIDGATESSYNITSDSIESVTKDTTWKYKAEIYDADDSNIKLTSKIYSVNIKPQQTTPNPSPEPSPDPTPPNPSPEPNPPSPNPPITNPDGDQTSSINYESIKLKNIGQLLPSQYLNNLSSEVVDVSLIEQRFDTNKITNVSYKLTELNDRLGTLSILMNYTEDSISKSYTFSFTNLLKLEDSGYNLEFVNATGILNLSAQTISEKTLDSKSKFEDFINELSNSDIKFKFKIKGIELPLNYLNFNKVNITGFSTKWFTTNNKLVLTFTFQNPKINYYVKTTNNNITLNNFEYPSNINKYTTMEFYSAVDYLLNQITNNNKYSTSKYASYYYYDILENEAEESQIQASSNYWLSNVTNYLTYKNENYTYTVILNTNNVSSENGSLTVNLSMEYQANNSSENSKSLKTKDVLITGFTKYNQENLFSNSSDVKYKFSLGCNIENYDKNIDRLKYRKEYIIKKIQEMNDEDSITFTSQIIPHQIIKTLTNTLICKFSNVELLESNSKSYYYNNLIGIEKYIIDNNDTLLQYDKKNDVFQLVINNFTILGVGINSDNYAENPNEMIVNITSPGNSLQKLKAA